MKVFISVDIEGIAGVVHWDETRGEGEEFQRARRWMTGEANAAVRGAFAGGADEVVVNDSHGQQRNLLAEELDPRARLVRGRLKPMMMMEGITPGTDAIFLVGYHARAGTGQAILNHTFSGKSIYQLSLNGRVVGEVGYNAALAGSLGSPVALVSGDDVLSREVDLLLPWAERVVVKRGVSSWAAENLSPQISCERIYQGAARALAGLSEMQLYQLPGPINMEITFQRPILADLAAWVPTARRVDGTTVAFAAENMMEINRAWVTVINLVSSQTDGYG